jgi:autotransporter-associated beta strand protein/uncharacterized repeat protein (TIGR03803 family)
MDGVEVSRSCGSLGRFSHSKKGGFRMLRASHWFAWACAVVLPLGFADYGAAQTFTSLLSFNNTDGANPTGDVLVSGSTIYGMASGDSYYNNSSTRGTIFSLATSGGNPTVIATFTSSSSSPQYPTGDLTLSAGTLYGMTSQGGASSGANSNDGCVFSISATAVGGSATELYKFNGTYGDLPLGGLTLNSSTLFGTTYQGGTHGSGNVFSVPTAGGTPTNLESFPSSPFAGPAGNLLLSGSTLYGMTPFGGNGYGSVFSVGTNGTGFTTLASFASGSGCLPFGSLLLSGSTLYGMTNVTSYNPSEGVGSESGDGTIFSIATSAVNSAPTTLFAFSGTTGGFNVNLPGNTEFFTQANNPLGGLTISGTTLYGMTTAGGASNHGNIFSIGTNGMGFTNLYSFTGGTDGGYPTGGVTLSGGTLFGMTFAGGTGAGANGVTGVGTVFAYALSGAATPAVPNQAVWTANNGSWATSANWIDTAGGGPSGAPGLSGSAGDTATFGTAVSGSATVTLDGAAPLLSGLIFSNNNVGYVLLQGAGTTGLTLTGTGGGSPAAVTVLSGTHSVDVPILLESNLDVSSSGSLTLGGNISDGGLGYSLALTGPGRLILGGTNSYSGGTDVVSGTLVVASAGGLADRSSLTVGADTAMLFAAPVAPPLAASPVAEPGTLRLLLAAFWSAMACRRFSKRPCLRSSETAARNESISRSFRKAKASRRTPKTTFPRGAAAGISAASCRSSVGKSGSDTNRRSSR